MSSFDADGWNRPPSTYDPRNRRGPLSKHHPGLRWRMTADGAVAYELNLRSKQTGKLSSDTLGARTEAEAIDAWEEARPKHKKGAVVLAVGDKRMADVAERYFERLDERIAQGKKKRKTKTGYEGNWRLHIEPAFGRTRVKDIDGEALVEFFAGLSEKGLSNWSQCGIKNVLNQMFKLAMRERWLTRNPFEDVDPDDLPTQQRRPGHVPRLLRNDELDAMVAACNPLYRNMLIVMAFTGLRIGEVCGLLWQDINLVAKEIEVARQLDYDEGWTTTDPKGRATAETNLSFRTIGMLAPAYEALAAQQTAEIVKGYGRPSDFVFTTSDWRGASGTPVSPDNLRSRGVQAAALDAEVGHVRPHDFRHTTASILAACQVPDTDAARWMGHTVEVYYKTYARSFADAIARRKTMKKLDRWFAKAA